MYFMHNKHTMQT